MNVAAILFVVAALGGLGMVVLRIRGRLLPPALLATVHGLLAVTGFGLLIREWALGGLPPLARTAVVVFGVAALGGAMLLFRYHVRSQPLPLGLMIVHGLVGATGVVLLLFSLLQTRGAYVPPVAPPVSGHAMPEGATRPSQP